MSSRFAKLMTAVVLLALLAGCDYLLPHTRSWTEDVQLDDGSVITIERYVRFEYSNSLAGDSPSNVEKRATLNFTGALSEAPTWDVPLIPMVLYRDAETKQWVIVAHTDRCEVWDVRGSPFPPYWEYRLVGSKWLEHPLSESSKGRFRNLFIDYRGKTQTIPQHVGLAEKKLVLGPGYESDTSNTFLRVIPEMHRYCMVNDRK